MAIKTETHLLSKIDQYICSSSQQTMMDWGALFSLNSRGCSANEVDGSILTNRSIYQPEASRPTHDLPFCTEFEWTTVRPSKQIDKRGEQRAAIFVVKSLDRLRFISGDYLRQSSQSSTSLPLYLPFQPVLWGTHSLPESTAIRRVVKCHTSGWFTTGITCIKGAGREFSGVKQKWKIKFIELVYNRMRIRIAALEWTLSSSTVSPERTNTFQNKSLCCELWEGGGMCPCGWDPSGDTF